MNRIIWNRRPSRADTGDIDEIVLHDVSTVHVEQMDDRCWWIGITKADGGYWAGIFIADSRGRMRFVEQECEAITWESDKSHERTP